MSNTTNIKIEVLSGDTVFTFVATAHKFDRQEDFFLDLIQFYLTFGRDIPKGEHWEIEILEPLDTLSPYKLHVARSARSTNPFVCYPASLPTLEKAMALFKVWCVGTVLTIEHGIDLNTAYKGDDEKFFAEMAERGITIEKCE